MGDVFHTEFSGDFFHREFTVIEQQKNSIQFAPQAVFAGIDIIFMPIWLANAMNDMSLSINNREFGRIVKGVL